MTHGDDDGLRLPPAIAPRQIVVVPMLRDKPEDAEVLAYCENLVKALAAHDGVRPAGAGAFGHQEDQIGGEALGLGAARGAVDRGVGPRDAAGGNVTYMRRDDLRDGDKIKSLAKPRVDFIEGAVQLLAEIQAGLYADAKARLDGNIRATSDSFEGMADYFGEDDDRLQGLGARGLGAADRRGAGSGRSRS